MKTLIIISLFVLCSCSRSLYPDEALIKTKIYVGSYEQSYINDGVCYIQTDNAVILLKEIPNIPLGSWCYIRRETNNRFHPDVARKLEHQYFSFNGSEKEYRVMSNIRF